MNFDIQLVHTLYELDTVHLGHLVDGLHTAPKSATPKRRKKNERRLTDLCTRNLGAAEAPRVGPLEAPELAAGSKRAASREGPAEAPRVGALEAFELAVGPWCCAARNWPKRPPPKGGAAADAVGLRLPPKAGAAALVAELGLRGWLGGDFITLKSPAAETTVDDAEIEAGGEGGRGAVEVESSVCGRAVVEEKVREIEEGGEWGPAEAGVKGGERGRAAVEVEVDAEIEEADVTLGESVRGSDSAALAARPSGDAESAGVARERARCALLIGVVILPVERQRYITNAFVHGMLCEMRVVFERHVVVVIEPEGRCHPRLDLRLHADGRSTRARAFELLGGSGGIGASFVWAGICGLVRRGALSWGFVVAGEVLVPPVAKLRPFALCVGPQDESMDTAMNSHRVRVRAAGLLLDPSEVEYSHYAPSCEEAQRPYQVPSSVGAGIVGGSVLVVMSTREEWYEALGHRAPRKKTKWPEERETQRGGNRWLDHVADLARIATDPV
ncbi:hypothetical protein FB451DRAFT_1468190 [Mycena latifolia]|nr:hypothetical protein FB451DRAFT_1468190 [Mycena latifolia]